MYLLAADRGHKVLGSAVPIDWLLPELVCSDVFFMPVCEDGG